ncbi:MAG TPA: hypothetical protein VI522_01690, partial [Gammaproteobacteria bacterium]|nr:hypothetical protein [Gammaproteobacteria bacterium]
LDEKTYEKYKKDLGAYGELVGQEMRNKQAFYRTQQKIMEDTIAFQRKNLIEQITRWAHSQHITLGSLNDCGEFVPTIDVNPTKKITDSYHERKKNKTHDEEAVNNSAKKIKLSKS